ncbi:hypothetical protein OGH69_01805 [Flavobacterium sp. MFBS3-15]|uniref:hypothetical protein n=1 Tax=Flavobacterium sp. MFBS3-15 TaxID=2989816 RepID=UPI0022366EA2|nr:hypothetical protein [Flavobacterium sp. MFBS3-15]MCW4467690.1 hypothetical protein [Flavobacterium sp. MFBS3-15]
MKTPTETTALDNIYMAQWAFSWSLGIGTAFELAFIITGWLGIPLIAFFFLIAVVLFNLVVFLNNIIFICLHREYRLPLLAYTLLMLINIPIAILYLYILTELGI